MITAFSPESDYVKYIFFSFSKRKHGLKKSVHPPDSFGEILKGHEVIFTSFQSVISVKSSSGSCF